MARARGRHFAGKSQRRLTEWSQYDLGALQGVASGGATLLSGLAFEDPGTIIRTRGSIVVKPQVYTADLTIQGCFGIGLVSAEAFGVGVTVVPEPYSDSDWGGWMVIQPFTIVLEFGTGVDIIFPAMVEYAIDSKAMRKVEPNLVMVFVAESLSGAFSIGDQTRLLQKLH